MKAMRKKYTENNSRKWHKKYTESNAKNTKNVALTFPNVACRGRPGERDALLLLRSFEVEHGVSGSQPFQDQGQRWLKKQQKLQNFTFWVYRSVRTRVFLCGPFDNIWAPSRGWEWCRGPRTGPTGGKMVVDALFTSASKSGLVGSCWLPYSTYLYVNFKSSNKYLQIFQQ